MNDPTTRFSDRVDSDRKYRPTHPAGIIDVLIRKIGMDSDDRVADIGTGAEISSALVLRNGNVVCGVEPNDALRQSSDELRVRFLNFESKKRVYWGKCGAE